MIKIQIKSVLGKVLFEYEKEKNTIKDTLIQAVKAKTHLLKSDLEGANLRGANLEGADLRGANLLGADLRGADLRGANLLGADLEGANLLGADLRGANLLGADLEGANLLAADLEGTNLRGAHLEGTNLRGAENYYCFVAFDTSKRIVHCVKHKKTWMIKAGCFWDSLEDLEKRVKETHNSQVYLKNIEILKTI